MWKYKILYFLYGTYINISNFIHEVIDEKELKYFPFFNEENIKWYAFENGPITSHYNYLKPDEKININFEKIDKSIIKALEDCYLILKKFSLTTLINESHNTDPWKENHEKGKYWTEIKTEEIIKYFRKNRPFYLKEEYYKIENEVNQKTNINQPNI